MRAALPLLLLTMALAPAALAQGSAGVAIEPLPERGARVGESVTFDVTVRNDAAILLHVLVDAGIPAWLGERTEPADPVPIRPGGRAVFRQTIDVHGWAPNGTRSVRIYAAVVEDLSLSTHAEQRIVISEPAEGPRNEAFPRGADAYPLPFPGLLLSAQVGEVAELPVGGGATVLLLLANPTNATRQLAVTASDGAWGAPAGLEVRVASGVRLDPGETETVLVSLVAPRTGDSGEAFQIPLSVDLGDGTSSFLGVMVRTVAPPMPPWWLWAAIAATVLATLATGAAAVRRRDDWRWLAVLPFAPLFTRLSKRKVLDHATRDRILALVRARPGIFWAEVKADTKLPTGVLVHHLSTLERHGLLVRQRAGRRLRFYAAGERPAVAAPVLTVAQERILAALGAGPLSQRELAAAIGLTQQGVSFHLARLEEMGRVAVVAEAPARRYAAVRTMEAAA